MSLSASLASRRPRIGLAIGLAILGFWVFVAVFGSAIAPYDPYADDLLQSLAPPSAAHWFGTDMLGRDVFSRVLSGARQILVTAPPATFAGVALGTLLGLVLGYRGGWPDAVFSRILDMLLSMPLVVTAMLILTTIGGSVASVILVIAVIYAPLVARTVRASVRTEAAKDYAVSARISGESALGVMVREILPNIRSVVFIEAMTRLGYAFFTVSTLSFLGLGLQPPSTDWGLAVAESYGLLTAGLWWVAAFPALAIISLVVATNLVAEAIGNFDD
ncbi:MULTISPECIES: ABC transporter permease [unclassified Aureimonas]|uniref:ABC transporter permease n=1 Tax=unclassified Aureimonas TaxID=2615206 RepID=UPI0006FFB7E8|nr:MULTISPECIES: ABC transporter permease [unclassified Aureimonas]KQT69011.1 peptide ABC transporter permease [Aureimonas sp. Leaf460]KQT69241.1 peptide ABC transporter permease [Aureimonas sp. Leaf427]